MPLPEIVPLHLLDALVPVESPSAKPQPISNIPSHAEVEEALRCLPTHFGTNSYNIWLEVLMAVHSVLPGSDGVALCERYVPGKPGEIEKKFKGFDGSGGVGVGTLFHIAEGYGFRPARRAVSYAAQLPELSNNEIHALITGERIVVPVPEIQINNRQLSSVVADLKDALKQRNELEASSPVVLRRGGVLVRMSGESIQSITLSGLNGIAADVARWVHIKPGKEDAPPVTYDVFPPRDVISTYLGANDWPELPELKGLLTAPAYVGNGRWVDSPGFDVESGLFLASNIHTSNTSPTPENLAWALDMLTQNLLVDFPFKDDASRAHALAFILLPFVRHIITGPTPMTLVDAPEKGTGKSLLVTACGIAALGDDVPSMAIGRDDEEIRKRITALLQKGTNIISFDNVTGKLDSASLAMALTQGVWEDRQLGSTQMLRLPIRTMWAATGNNVQPSDEIARRCVWIRLDASMERPSERTGFRHADLLGWARQHRADLIRAAVIVINNWAERGEPVGNYTKGSFQTWANVIGGILDAAGITGFLANERELFSAAVSDLQLWGAFVEAWASTHSSFWITTKDLFALASHYDTAPTNGPDGLGLLDDLLGAGNERSRQTRLGKQLGQMTDRVIRGWKITRGGITKGYQQWRLTPALASGVDVADHTSTPDLPEVGVDVGGRRGDSQPPPYIEDPINTFMQNSPGYTEDGKTSTTSTNVHPQSSKNGVDVAITRPPSQPMSTLNGHSEKIEDLGL